MFSFLIIFLLFVLFLWAIKEYYQIKLGVGPQPSPKQIANELISLCKDLNVSGTFLDIGSGWGSVIIPMSKALPDWRFYGIEKSPTPWFVSQLKTFKNKNQNISLLFGDAESFRYRGYDIIYVNIHKKLLNEITPALTRNIQRGSLVVTYRNKIDGLEAFNTISVSDNNGHKRFVYLYIKSIEKKDANQSSSDKKSDDAVTENIPNQEEKGSKKTDQKPLETEIEQKIQN